MNKFKNYLLKLNLYARKYGFGKKSITLENHTKIYSLIETKGSFPERTVYESVYLAMPTKEISIIIPTLNEEKTISQCLETVVNIPGIEIIVSDGGSTDRTVEIAGKHRDVKVVHSLTGRSVQMNNGAACARGEILLFLHADCILPREDVLKVRQIFDSGKFVGGAFQIRLLSDKFPYRWLERGINFRSKVFKLPYGDQGLFVKRSLFEKLGGFREMPICEDLDFVCRLKKCGRIVILNERIFSSIRRWKNHGILRTSFRNQLLLYSYMFRQKTLRTFPGQKAPRT